MLIYENSQPGTPAPATTPGTRTFSYDNTPGQSSPAQTGPSSLLGDDSFSAGSESPKQATADTTNPGQDQEEGPRPPVISFAEDGAGDPPASYDMHLSGFFDGREMDAAVRNQHELREQLTAARTGLKEALTEYQVGDTAAREMFAAVKGYVDNPRSPERIEADRETTMAALQKKWGGETDKMIKAAQQVLNEISRKVPGLADTLVATGAANDFKTIVHLANIGKRRGYLQSLWW